MSEYNLFKFKSINKYLLDSLVKGEMYFTHPDHLNDPFDCRVDIKKSLNNAIAQSTGTNKENLLKLTKMGGFFEQVQKDLGSFGVCAFSLELENSLLWSHYAGEHRGVCLLYRIPESFINCRSHQIIGISSVKYETNPLTEWFKQISVSLPNTGFQRFGTELVKKVLTIKNRCWSYEKEIRIIREVVGKLEIDKSFLQQVCFGLNTSDEDISLIKKLIDSCGYSVTYCRITRSENDFGIVAVEI